MFGSKAELSSAVEVESKFLTLKSHALRGKYARLFAMTKTTLLNIDPDNWSVTNTWPYPTDVVDFSPNVSSPDEFTLTVKDGKKNNVLKFTCQWRSDLLCDLQRFSSAAVPGRRFVGFKITRALVRVECMIEVQRAAILHIASDGSVRSTYYFRHCNGIKAFSDDASAFALYFNGRPRMFASPERDALLRIVAEALTKLGLSSIMSDERLSTTDYRTVRAAHGNDRAPKLAEFDVLKVTSKYSTPRPRRLVITENSITERDTSTYTVISCRPISTLFAIVRHWDEPQKVTFEYAECQSRTYVCSYRDELVASALDGAANAGNRSVEVVAVTLKQGLRCFPRTLELDVATEAIYLKRLQGVCKKLAEGAVTGPYSSELHAA